MAGCEACAHEEAAEALLSELLEHRLPQHAAPLALKRRLAAAWPDAAAPAPPWWAGWRRALVPALALGVLLLAALPLYYPQSGGAGAVMVAEAVNDHLRLLASQHPLDIESGGMHQVKPWFEGRLDFAPVVRFLGDDDFPLRGGAVGYYLDRKAARLRLLPPAARDDAAGLPAPTGCRGPAAGSSRSVACRRRSRPRGGSTRSCGARASWATRWCPTPTCRIWLRLVGKTRRRPPDRRGRPRRPPW